MAPTASRSAATGFVYLTGAGAMFVAVSLQNITLASQRYGPTLLAALGLMCLADLLGLVVWRRGTFWRIAAAVTMLPSVFIVCDFLRRALYSF